MAKTRTKKTAARKRPLTVEEALAKERRTLKNLVRGKRDLARLVTDYRRAARRADTALVLFAVEIVAVLKHHPLMTARLISMAPPASGEGEPM